MILMGLTNQMLDYIIIGAGPSGLCAAKTILECDPDANLRLFDRNKTVGGVWATEHLYPGLKTNNLRPGIDFTDFPMDDQFGGSKGQPITGEAMHKYLDAYARKWDLLKRIDFQVEVLEISQLNDAQGWKVKVNSSQQEQVFETRKLIVATGITNRPHRPTIEGSGSFTGLIIHSADLGMKSHLIVDDPSVKRVAVLGGGKSSYDAVYLAASRGKEVEWIIRKSGKGPAWVFPSHTFLGPFRVWRERLVTTRFVSFFSPWLWQDGFGWMRKFLHFTSVGKTIAKGFWTKVSAATLDECGYAKDQNLHALHPETSVFWYGTASGVNNYETNLFQFIQKGQVRLHREDVDHLSASNIHLADGSVLQVDALVTATGFSAKPTVNFVPSSIHSDLGIPTTELSETQKDFWTTQNHKAELAIVSRYPRLLQGPFQGPSSNVILPFNPGVDPELNYTPFRLYRAIAPPGLTTHGDRSLAFVGVFSNIANTIRLELQCLWAYAYLTDQLAVDEKTVFDEAALFSRYCRYRSPFGHGRFFPDLAFDQVPYFDVLMADLKLPYWRKGNVFKEMFVPYSQQDYAGVVQEWLAKEKRKTIPDRGHD